jgi:signal transduction histidine kinase
VANAAVASRSTVPTQATSARAVDFDRRHPQIVDALAALVLLAVSIPWMIVHTAHGAPAWVFQIALVVPLVWRRRYPLGVFYGLCAVAFGQWIWSQPLLANASLLAALFTIALYRPLRIVLPAAVLLEVGVVMASVKWSLTDSRLTSVVALTGLVAAAVLAGSVLQIRRAHMVELTDRATRLETERDQQARFAAAAERTRIAREMHDVIAHSLAVIVTMADGATAKLPHDPKRAAAAVGSIAEVARDALGDTRRLLGVLRERQSGVDMNPQPGLEQLYGLIDQLKATGLAATLHVTGPPFPLAPAAELTVYRLLQEATNTLKHGTGATRFDARLTYAYPLVQVEACDDGRPEAGSDRPGGHGLAGMRERVALYGGTLTSERGPGGGWHIAATLVDPARNGG